MKKEGRIIGYDILRIIAIIMVVIIHSNVIYLSNNQGSVLWILVMEFTALCVVSVPVFFMLSGAVLLDCTEIVGIKQLFAKRISKQIIPFMAWSIIYVVLRIAMGKIPLSIDSFLSLLNEPAYYQFWFMYTLLSIYLLLPILQKIVIHASKTLMEYILLLWIIFCVLIPMISKYIPKLTLSSHIDLIVCEGYIGYFLLGYYLKKYPIFKENCNNWILMISGIVITTIGAMVEWFLNRDSYTGYVYCSYMLPGAVLASIGLYSGMLNKKWRMNVGLEKIITSLSSLSIGVFYIHMLVLTGLEYLGITGTTNIGELAFKIILTYIISLMLALVISKIKYFRTIFLGFK